MAQTKPVSSTEEYYLKRLLIASISVHILGFWLDPSSLLPEETLEPEWTIETQLVEDFGSAEQDSLKQAKPAEELRVAKNMLPQLTKSSVQEALSQQSSTDGEEDKTQDKDLMNDLEDQKKKERQERKRLALERLLKEKARLNKKFAKKTTAPLDAVLKKRKNELDKRYQSNILLSGKISKTHGYAGTLRSWIARFYSIPELYRIREKKLTATVEMIIDRKGQVKKLMLASSSSDQQFDSLALDTIKKAEPFPRPPRHWVGKVITVPFQPNRTERKSP